jgi:hypothetical protein
MPGPCDAHKPAGRRRSRDGRLECRQVKRMEAGTWRDYRCWSTSTITSGSDPSRASFPDLRRYLLRRGRRLSEGGATCPGVCKRGEHGHGRVAMQAVHRLRRAWRRPWPWRLPLPLSRGAPAEKQGERTGLLDPAYNTARQVGS